MEIEDFIKDDETFLSLPPEELGGIILVCLNSRPTKETDKFTANKVFDRPSNNYFNGTKKNLVERVCMEAIGWLEKEILIARDQSQPGSHFFITRRGKEITNKDGFNFYQQASLLPKSLIHTSIADDVYLLFLKGKYDTAVFEAFKAVEVAVRGAGNFSNSTIGKDLMRKAFDPQNGVLSDKSSTTVTAEKQSLSDLYAGAIGYYKNPTSHRKVSIENPNEAIEMIIIASHLLRIVDERKRL